jgi:hypothetical protein
MPKAVEYILQVFDQIPSMDELLQMSIIEVIRLDCKTDTSHRVCIRYDIHGLTDLICYYYRPAISFSFQSC